MKNNDISVVSIVATVLLILMLIGASFAYFGNFSTNVNNVVSMNVETYNGFNSSFVSSSAPLNLHATLANMVSAEAGDVVASESENLNVSLVLGGTGATYTCTYDIVFEYDEESDVYGNGTTTVTNPTKNELTLLVTGPNVGTNNYSTEKNFNYDANWTQNNSKYRRVIVQNASISSSSATSTDQAWNINLKFYILSESQAQLQGHSFTGNFFIENVSCSE